MMKQVMSIVERLENTRLAINSIQCLGGSIFISYSKMRKWALFPLSKTYYNYSSRSN